MSLTSMSPEISVVVPLYNEAANVAELHRQLTEALRGQGRSYELILVDDGSTDDTFRELTALHALDTHVCVVRLRRNFGVRF